MRILISGSRLWNDVDLMASVMEKFPKGTTIIHGDAKGADTIAHCIAESLEFQIERYPVTSADWEKFGKGAGHLRNTKMLDQGGPDLVVAFVLEGAENRGTKNMIAQAESRGFRVVIIDGKLKPTVNTDT